MVRNKWKCTGEGLTQAEVFVEDATRPSHYSESPHRDACACADHSAREALRSDQLNTAETCLSDTYGM